MTSKLADTVGTAAMATAGERGASVAIVRAATAADFIRRAVGALARRCAAAWKSARSRRRVYDGWDAVERERYLRDAVDAPDLERRQRQWDRDESGAYRMSGWN